MKWYPTRAAIVRHMHKAKFCLAHLVRCSAPLSAEESNEYDKVDIEHRKAYGKTSKNALVKGTKTKRVPGPLQLFDDEDTIISQLANLESAAVSAAAHQELAQGADPVSDAGNDTASDNDSDDDSRHIPAPCT